MVGHLAVPGAIAGTDYAGYVVAIGNNAQCPGLKIGDRVAGDEMSFEEAATMGSGIGTMGLALFRSLGVPGYPGEPALKPKHVLVYGGSSATGTMAIQLLRLAGGKYTALEPYPTWLDNKKTVKADWVFGPMMLGKKIGWPVPFEREADDEVRDFSIKWFETARKLLQDGKIKAHPLRSMSGSFQGVIDGMDSLRKKEISGVKLVYRVASE
ncbi:putative protein TOXD [Glarea lozoyensis 74030]|uniref:Uncharacterized protein n=1 Tax=Glarea lozoyensis (strain ATCC 74030 / MF5533) TaxID=1104152 RepID=H0EVX9_GLAL7|nr:putative protein TOXD [Glarea lozoyensis 74030]